MTALAAAGVVLAAVPAGADAEAFRIGMVARHGGEPAVEGLSVIRSAFSRALGMQVEVYVARDYAALIEAHVAGRLDYAVYSAPAYAAASLRCGCLRPVVAPVDADGSVGLRSVLIARPGEGPARLAVGPADSLAARLAPLASSPQAAEAAEAGLLVEAGSASAAEAMFVAGSVDGFFGWVPAGPDGVAGASPGGSPARLQAAGLDTDDYEVRWRSQVMRYGPHAVRADLPAARVETLAQMLTHAGAERPDLYFYLERRHGGGFAPASQDDYAAAIEALSALSSPARP